MNDIAEDVWNITQAQQQDGTMLYWSGTYKSRL